MECPECGEGIDSDSVFCEHCLTLLDDTSESNSRESKRWLPSIPTKRGAIVIGLAIFLTVGIGVFSLGVDLGNIETPDNVNPFSDDRVDKPPEDIVVQLDQLDLGWRLIYSESDYRIGLFTIPAEYPSEINGKTAITAYAHGENDEDLVSIAGVANTSNAAETTYTSYQQNVTQEYSTEPVEVGDEGMIYTNGGTTVITFRQSNVFGMVVHDTNINQPDIQQAENHTDRMIENIES